MMRHAVAMVLVLAACGPSVTGGNGDAGPPPVELSCDPLQGLSYDPDSGKCEGACAPEYLGQNYIGCDYYPTVTANEVNSTFEFAVAVSNTSSDVASITVEWGALAAPLRFDVPAGEVRTQVLPWHPDLKGCMGEVGFSCAGLSQPISTLAPKGAYRLRSTRPVTVYQFNPLDYRKGDLYSYTNDASLLLPRNALGTSYQAASWTAQLGQYPSPGFLAITATADDTAVTITTRVNTEGGRVAPPFQAGVPQTVVMHHGDVLQLVTNTGDLTGSRIEADRPVQVVGGHFCTFIPGDVGWCDHLEESIFPIAALSREYVVAAPVVPSLPAGKVRVVRIVATEDDTTVTYDPPQAGPTWLARAGDSIDLPDNDATFVISADKKVLVAQYMEGQEVAGDTGDPAMALAVPTDQYRTTYLFHAPTNYDTNYVEVIGPLEAAITLDDAAVGSLTPIGATGLGVTRIVLGAGPRGDGNHRVAADLPVGIQVYGYGQYTSYWYPGGLDLAPIIIP